jgi:tetratricopeptide (TPR) repeat protein
MHAASCAVGLLSVLCSSPATSPGTRPDAAVDVWLDRAAGEVARVAGTPGQLNLLPELSMGVTLVRLRGSEADRALLRKLMDAPPPAKHAKATQAAYELGQKLAAAEALAALGEIAGAREVLAVVEQDVGRLKPAFPGAAEFGVAWVWACAGDVERAIAWATREPGMLDTPSRLCLLAGHVASLGRDDLRDRVFGAALEVAAAEDDPEERGRMLRNIASKQAEAGDIAGGLSTANAIEFAYHKVDALQKLAEIAHSCGDHPAAHRMLGAALDTMPLVEGYSRREMGSGLGSTAVRVGDREAFLRAAAIVESALEREDAYASLWAKLAFGAAAFQQREMMERYLKSAEAELNDLEEPKHRADAELYIAAAYARAGRRDEALAWVARSKKTFPPDDYSVPESFPQFVRGTIECGDPEQALADAAAAYEDDADADFARERAVRFDVARGRFASAWKTARAIRKYQHRRIAACRYVAEHQVWAGEHEQVVDEVNELADPRERAVVYLGVAHTSLRGGSSGPLQSFDLNR